MRKIEKEWLEKWREKQNLLVAADKWLEKNYQVGGKTSIVTLFDHYRLEGGTLTKWHFGSCAKLKFKLTNQKGIGYRQCSRIPAAAQ